jgi:hypothetical protein
MNTGSIFQKLHRDEYYDAETGWLFVLNGTDSTRKTFILNITWQRMGLCDVTANNVQLIQVLYL